MQSPKILSKQNVLCSLIFHRMPSESVHTIEATKRPLNERLKILNLYEMFRSVWTIKNEWKLKNPFEKWCYLYGIGKAAFTLNCFPLFKDNQAVHWFIYYIVLYFGIHFVLVLNTIFYYFVTCGELGKCLPCTCMLSIFLAVSFDPNHFVTYELPNYK